MIRICGFYDRIFADLGSQLMLATELKDRYICVEHIEGVPLADVSLEDFSQACLPVFASENARVIMLGTALGNIRVDDEPLFAAQTETLKKVLEMATLCDAKGVRVYPFLPMEGRPIEHSFYPAFTKIRSWVKLAAEKGVTLCFENLAGTIAETGMQCRLMERSIMNDYFKFIFNVASFYKAGLDPIKEYRDCKQSVYSIAVCDVDKNMQEMPLGMGECRLKDLLAEAISSGFDSRIILYPDTANYSALRRKLYFNPLLRAMFKGKVELFRKIDKKFGYTRHDIVSKNDVCRAQHQLLSDMLADAAKK